MEASRSEVKAVLISEFGTKLSSELPNLTIEKNCENAMAPTPALKIEWHSFSTPIDEVCALNSTPIMIFLESKLSKPKMICH